MPFATFLSHSAWGKEEGDGSGEFSEGGLYV